MCPDVAGFTHRRVARRSIQLTSFTEAVTEPARGTDAGVFLVFLARGAGVVRVSETAWPLLRGAACLTHEPPTILGPVLRGWTLAVDAQHLEAGDEPKVSSQGVRILPAGVAQRCAGFFEALEAELDRGEDHASPSAVKALVELILLCYERSPHPERGPVFREQGGRARQLVDETLEVIDDRYTERLSLSDIATALNRSSSSLTRAARTVTGSSVVELIAERRITEARRLLIESTLSVAEIAARVGYPSTGHFHRVPA